MSSRADDARRGQPTRPSSAVIAAIVALIAILAIVGYAVLRANRAVPGAAVATSDQTLPAPLQAGAAAPSFQVNSAIGSFSSADLAGKPYLLEIFATWCPHCQRMTKVLRAVRSSIPQSRMAMLSVTGSPYASSSTPNSLVPENQQDVNAFESAFGVTWPTFFDPDLAVAKKFGLNGFPTIYVVNGKGKIVYASSGEVSKGVLLNAAHQAGV